MTVVAVKFEDTVFQDLEEASTTADLSSEEMISRIVKNYLHIEKMNKIRRELKGSAETAGFFSEDDIYNEIS
ncbi:hypothetical protein [Spirosoma rhododendri]|uniref:CopG family transcriptional regulator n=1 Tax=Spirosoma rhododendri TaxID=2728024 RepID=A0A7L5DLL9_9BACT|nr:hypothetical protein [Spirosoma rhododendri]QJD78083.1 hypothetical protein HH216_06365 [Spirosoma rhododendri]